MCRISDKIKFCTCSASSTNELKHYWAFYRFNQGKRDIIIGDIIMPVGFADKETIAYNEALLLQRVNEPDAFDVDLAPQENDRLLISIRTGDEASDYQYYGFEWSKGRWVSLPYEFSEWKLAHDEILIGKIKSLFD